jgi:DNA-directed RNA polymerase I, II, and III subunit RPABC1
MNLRNWLPQIGTLDEMLRDRGCSGIALSLAGSDPLHLCSARDSTGNLVVVFLTDETKTGVKTMRKIREEAVKLKARRAILICPEGLTPFAVREVRGLQPSSSDEQAAAGGAPTCHLEVFRRQELSFNVTKHKLVPPHRIVPTAERKQLLANLSCKASALPKIRETDPVVRYLGCPVGTILEIERALGQLEPEVYYRIVVP